MTDYDQACLGEHVCRLMKDKPADGEARMIAVALALMISEPTNPPDLFVGVMWSVGVGDVKCEFAWDDAHKYASLSWTLGFWSGANATAGSTRFGGVGSSLGQGGIIAAVKTECAAKPAETLGAAVSNVYIVAARNKR